MSVSRMKMLIRFVNRRPWRDCRKGRTFVPGPDMLWYPFMFLLRGFNVLHGGGGQWCFAPAQGLHMQPLWHPCSCEIGTGISRYCARGGAWTPLPICSQDTASVCPRGTRPAVQNCGQLCSRQLIKVLPHLMSCNHPFFHKSLTPRLGKSFLSFDSSLALSGYAWKFFPFPYSYACIAGWQFLMFNIYIQIVHFLLMELNTGL